METKIEELKIEINPRLKPKGKIETEPLSETLNKCSKIYYCSSELSTQFMADNCSLPVLRGYYKAYVKHCPICITPDILWMLAVQGFSRHVENNAEQLRYKLLDFQGKKELTVDEGVEETLEKITKKGWEKRINSLVEKIRENVGGLIIGNLTPCFTTTTPIIQISSQIAIMSTFQSYFTYGGIFGGCGFPYIKLQGTYMDYMQLKFKLQALLGYNIDDWLNILIPIIDKILEAKTGNIDKKFWENFLKNHYSDGLKSDVKTKVEKISGWLLNFYPFFKGNKRRIDFNEPIEVEKVDDLTEEIIDVPLIMTNRITGEKIELKCKTGFLGTIQNKNYEVKPEIGCYICA